MNFVRSLDQGLGRYWLEGRAEFPKVGQMHFEAVILSRTMRIQASLGEVVGDDGQYFDLLRNVLDLWHMTRLQHSWVSSDGMVRAKTFTKTFAAFITSACHL